MWWCLAALTFDESLQNRILRNRTFGAIEGGEKDLFCCRVVQ
jgi:hypothetical protein